MENNIYQIYFENNMYEIYFENNNELIIVRKKHTISSITAMLSIFTYCVLILTRSNFHI